MHPMDPQPSITESELDCMLFDKTAEPKPLPFSLLERITDNFSYKMEIGRGAFAVVYKAMLQKGVVAVKKLSNTYKYENEFFREVECLMKVKHENIVRFLGYCVDTQGHMRMYEGKFVLVEIQQRLLCFEYLPNGGLDQYIKDPSCGLQWLDRYDIIKGICVGLQHLHDLNIVHLDLKPANILLDENMEPKIADFGISRSFEKDQTRVIATRVLGTLGYMAPEYVENIITKKYDLYSLGIIIMEIVTGKKWCQGVEQVLQSWSDRLDITQRNQQCEQIRVCVEIGIECTDFDQAKRPVNMKHIIKRLGETEKIKEISPRIKMIDIGITSSSRSLHSLDTNHTKQWVITGEDNGHIFIWNYQTEKKVDSFQLSEPSEVVCVKFIARKQWFAAASGYNIYVYSYETKMQQITSINAGSSDKSLHTMAVHPTKSYLFSSDSGTIKLWNWDKNWECTNITEANNSEASIYHVALSSKDTIALATLHCTVKVCTLDSAESSCTLSGHSASIRCLDFFTWDDQEYLVTGSDDQTAKIWDMENKICLCTMKVFESPVIFVMYRPDLQVLMTGSQDGSIYLWRICSRIRRRAPKLEQTVSIQGGSVCAVACSMGMVVIAKKDAIAIMDIDCVDSREKSTDYSEPELTVCTTPDGAKTYKVINLPSKNDHKQYRSSEDSSLQSAGTGLLEVIDEEQTIETPNIDDSSRQLGRTHLVVNDVEPTISPPDSGSTSRPAEPGRVQLVIKSSKTAPLLEHKHTVMLELTGGEYSSDRPGLDLVLLLDVSSFRWGRDHELKIATQFVVEKLSTIDRLGMVTFYRDDIKATLLREMSEGARQELVKLIDNFTHACRNGNNVKKGLLYGLKILAERTDSTGRVAAIILVSDKQQDTGEASEISIGNVPVYTFGFGAGSDHKVLSAVAANSMGGTFSHIPDEELSGGLTMAFSRCLAGLHTVSVQDLELTVAPVGEESKIVKTTAGSFPQTQLNDMDGGGSVRIRFGNLYSSEARKAIVHLRLAACDGIDHSLEFLKVTYSYNSSSGGRNQFVRPVIVWRTDDVHILEEEKLWQTELHAEKARLQAVEFIQQAAKRATVSLEQGHQMLVEAQNMVMLERSNPLITIELQELHHLFQNKETYMKHGCAYALSLVSSHNRQRSAVRGSDMEIMRLFATPCMDMYHDQAMKLYQDSPIINEALPGDYFVGRPGNDDEHPKKDKAGTNEALPDDYFVGRPANDDEHPKKTKLFSIKKKKKKKEDKAGTNEDLPDAYFVGRPANDDEHPKKDKAGTNEALPDPYFVGRPANDDEHPKKDKAGTNEALLDPYFVGRPANDDEHPKKNKAGTKGGLLRLWPWRSQS